MALSYIKDIQGYVKAKKIEEYCLATDRYVDIKDSVQGIRVGNKILIAYKKSRWKILGEYQWYPYYGITKLMDAFFDDRLLEYAEEQQNTNRKINSAKVTPISEAKIKEINAKKMLNYLYRG
jgi:hypothetical protein